MSQFLIFLLLNKSQQCVHPTSGLIDPFQTQDDHSRMRIIRSSIDISSGHLNRLVTMHRFKTMKFRQVMMIRVRITLIFLVSRQEETGGWDG